MSSVPGGAGAGKPELLRRIKFASPTTGWAVGHRGSILHSSDGGESWAVQFRVAGVYLRDLDFVDKATGWVVGHEGTILATRDGGDTWRRQELKGYTGRDVPRLNGISAIDRDRAVIVGEFGVVAITDDGGRTWNLAPAPTKITLTSVAANETGAVAVGLDGSVLAITLDDPSSPRIDAVDSGTDEHLLDVSMGADGAGYAVGRSTLLRFGPKGISALGAAPEIELPYVWLGGVGLLPNGEVWAVGMRGIVLRADDSAPDFRVALRLGRPKEISVTPKSEGS